MILRLRHFLGWIVSAFGSHQDLILENLALRQQLLALQAQETSPTTECLAKAVLGHVAKPLVRVGEASRLGHTPNGCRLASSRLPTVLEVAFTKGKVGRTEAGEQRDSGLDSPDVC
jgi:hypothetical protein